MALSLTDEDKRKLKENFNLLDKDNSGVLSERDIATVIRSTGKNPSKSELELMFHQIYEDGYKEVKFNTFLEYYVYHFHASKVNDERDTMKAFKEFDKNEDGFIELDELKKIMTEIGEDKLSDKEYEEMISDFDVNSDGKIDYYEFINIMNNVC